MKQLVLTLLIAAAPLAAHAAAPVSLMTARDLMSIPVRAPDKTLEYGSLPSQFGELRLPSGKGPFPLVILVHGGCFSSYAGASSIGAMADALKAEGFATWSIEYRRLPEAGSGWPGTYDDVGQAIDFVRTLEKPYNLDLSRVVFVGHSAGGHLAHWAAARRKIKASSPLYVTNPLIPTGVINLAGRMDMAEGIEAYEKTCNAPVVRQLLGGEPTDVPDRYHDASPSKLIPLEVPQVMIWGSLEEYVPQAQAEAFVKAAKYAGDDVRLVIIPDVGHFETASPLTAAWPTVLGMIKSLTSKE